LSAASSNFRLILFLVIGALIGSILNEMLYSWGAPEWLTRYIEVGLNPPPDSAFLDLYILTFTLGFSLKLSFCTVLGLALGLFLFKRLR